MLWREACFERRGTYFDKGGDVARRRGVRQGPQDKYQVSRVNLDLLAEQHDRLGLVSAGIPPVMHAGCCILTTFLATSRTLRATNALHSFWISVVPAAADEAQAIIPSI